MATKAGDTPAESPVRGVRGEGVRASHSRRRSRLILAISLLVVLCVASIYLFQKEYRVHRLSGSVRELIAARKFAEASPLIERWLALKPGSADAYFARALVALGENRLPQAASDLDEAAKLGLDRSRQSALKAVIQARAGRSGEAERGLLQAYLEKAEPVSDVAQELARLYLSTYRLSEARAPIERWQSLAPDDPRPYLWLNEIESRTDGEPVTLIENYRAALERDPELETARLGLGAQLLKASRLDEAEREFRAHLARKPSDPTALVGLGRTMLRRGDVDSAAQQFEAALEADPRQPDALRELAQIELSRGRDALACARLEVLVQVEPHDHSVRYQYAQALRRAGEESRSREEFRKADVLRADNDRLLELQKAILARPGDREAQFEVARWLLEHGHDEGGLDWTRQILKSDPRHARTHRLLADYHARRGEEGLANYHRLLSEDGTEGGGSGRNQGTSRPR